MCKYTNPEKIQNKVFERKCADRGQGLKTISHGFSRPSKFNVSLNLKINCKVGDLELNARDNCETRANNPKLNHCCVFAERIEECHW